MRITTIVLFVSLFASLTFGVGGDLGLSTDPLTDGSASHPWLIEDFADFQEFCSDSAYWAENVYTELRADIDLDPSLPGREVYTQAPIAPYGENGDFVYKGNFNGNRYSIRNLNIDTAGTSGHCLGLFSYLTVGMISDLVMENAYINGADQSIFIGSICGYNNGSILNCEVSSKIYGFFAVGGICGFNEVRYNWAYGVIEGCKTEGVIQGGNDASYIGGLCGTNVGGIKDCCSYMDISVGNDASYIGGLCGETRDYSGGYVLGCIAKTSIETGDYSRYIGGGCGYNTLSIEQSYSSGMISCGYNAQYVGGMCGQDFYSASNLECYSNTSITTGRAPYYIGGFSGSAYQASRNCYWDVEASGVGLAGDDNYGAIGMTTAQMKMLGTYAGWDFDDTWWINDGRDYPKLYFQPFGDLNNDCVVDLVDLGVMSRAWLASNGEGNFNSVCELSGDSDIDESDLLEIGNMWLEGPIWE